MKKFDTELLVGILLLCGAGLLVYLSLRLGQVDLFGSQGYTVHADFSTAGGLQSGATVELSGVEIGRVEAVDLVDYQARVVMKIRDGIVLHEDAQAALKNNGLIGERYVEITPGKAPEKIPPGGQIKKTEAPVDIQEAIAKFIFGNVEGKGQAEAEEDMLQ